MPGERRDVGLGRVGGLAAQRVPLVVEADHGGAEVDVEGLRGGAADVEPAQHRRLEDAQRVGRGRHAAGRGRHLLHAGEPDEGVDDARGRTPVEDRGRDLGADGVGRARGSCGRGRRARSSPARGPSASASRPSTRACRRPVGRQVRGALVAARGARVRQRRGLVVVRRRGDGVAPALAAVGAEGEARLGVRAGASSSSATDSARSAASSAPRRASRGDLLVRCWASTARCRRGGETASRICSR